MNSSFCTSRFVVSLAYLSLILCGLTLRVFGNNINRYGELHTKHNTMKNLELADSSFAVYEKYLHETSRNLPVESNDVDVIVFEGSDEFWSYSSSIQHYNSCADIPEEDINYNEDVGKLPGTGIWFLPSLSDATITVESSEIKNSRYALLYMTLYVDSYIPDAVTIKGYEEETTHGTPISQCGVMFDEYSLSGDEAPVCWYSVQQQLTGDNMIKISFSFSNHYTIIKELALLLTNHTLPIESTETCTAYVNKQSCVIESVSTTAQTASYTEMSTNTTGMTPASSESPGWSSSLEPVTQTSFTTSSEVTLTSSESPHQSSTQESITQHTTSGISSEVTLTSSESSRRSSTQQEPITRHTTSTTSSEVTLTSSELPSGHSIIGEHTTRPISYPIMSSEGTSASSASIAVSEFTTEAIMSSTATRSPAPSVSTPILVPTTTTAKPSGDSDIVVVVAAVSGGSVDSPVGGGGVAAAAVEIKTDDRNGNEKDVIAAAATEERGGGGAAAAAVVVVNDRSSDKDIAVIAGAEGSDDVGGVLSRAGIFITEGNKAKRDIILSKFLHDTNIPLHEFGLDRKSEK